MSNQKKVPGAQSLQRAAAILRFIAKHGRNGITVQSISENLNLNISTADRMVRALCHENLLERGEKPNLFRIGPDIIAFSASRTSGKDLTSHYKQALDRISTLSGDTVYLWLKSGLESVCVYVQEGKFPIQATAARVGSRVPLGISVGSLAQLSFLEQPEINEILESNSEEYTRLGLDRATVESKIKATLRRGFAFESGEMIAEMSAVGVPVFGYGEKPVASITVATIKTRLPLDRAEQLACEMNQILSKFKPVL